MAERKTRDAGVQLHMVKIPQDASVAFLAVTALALTCRFARYIFRVGIDYNVETYY